MSNAAQGNMNIIQLEDGWNNVIKTGVSFHRLPPQANFTADIFYHAPRNLKIHNITLFYTPQAIDVLERTLDNGFDTSFEPKEYIRIYT